MLRRRRGSEDGATAILTAVVAVVLFGFAALAVDLGNALSRKGDTQVTADFAALAGGALLPGTKLAGDPVVQAVARYFVDNAARDDDAASAPTVAQMAGRLVNGSDADGEIHYDGPYELRVISPRAYVDFGLAGALGLGGGDGYSGVEVASDATVVMGSPKGHSVLPMYVANPSPGEAACDYGLQTLTDPPGGHVVPPSVPTLAFQSHTNATTVKGLALFEGGVSVSSVTPGSTTASVTIEGDFKNATSVGFFRSDDPAAAVVEVGRAAWDDPVGTTPYTLNKGQVTLDVPAAVASTDELWYVRVFEGAPTGRWSASNEAQAVSVGDAPYECVGGSADGNFGTLRMPRSDVPSTWVPRNIALGLQAPLTLARFPGAPPPWVCGPSVTGSVISSAALRKPGTNCLDTDTGLTQQTATTGFITGDGSYNGLLDTGSSSPDPDGSGGCSPSGTTDPHVVLGKHLNNDLLTCFLTDTTTELGSVARRSYAGGPAFSIEIYGSPRFVWVPVFRQETVSGGSGYYSIVDFRPGFLTDQPMTATKGSNAVGSSTANGLGMNGNKLETIKVVFLNPNSLPQGDSSTPVGPYLGVGPSSVALVD